MPYEIAMFANDGIYRSAITYLDSGVTPPALRSVSVPGDAIAVQNVTFEPIGSVLDRIGTWSFRVPLTANRNNAIQKNTRIAIRDIDLDIVMAEGYVNKRDVTGDTTGEYAQISGVDLMDELRRDTVTAGFVTALNEPLAATGTRLARLSSHPWLFVTTLGSAFDGVQFTAANTSVMQAYGDFATQRHAHIARRIGAANGTPGATQRAIVLDTFGQPSGIRLEQMAPNPTGAHRDNPAVRQIMPAGFSFVEDANIVNTLVPVGSGNGITQVTLQPLYNPTGQTLVDANRQIYVTGPITFQGYDPTHPIYRRPRQDGGGGTDGKATSGSVDGYEYFIRDDASIAANGEWWGPWSEQGIALGGTTPAYFTAAAVSLYQASLAHLSWNSQPHTEYRITTDGWGDLRGLGGKTVRVIYQGIAEERIGFGQAVQYVSVNVNLDLTVMAVQIAEADDQNKTATWTLSTLGKYAASDTSVIIQALGQVEYGNYTVQTTIGTPNLPIDDVLDVNHPIIRTFPGNGGTIQCLEAKVSLYVTSARAEWRPHAHPAPIPAIPHDINDLNHDVNALPHDVNALPHDLAAQGSWHFQTGGTDHGTGGVDYNPTPQLNITTDPPTGAVPVMFDGKFLYATRHGSVPVPADTLQIFQANPTTGGRGGKVVATTGAADGKNAVGGTVAKTTGGKGGIVGKTSGGKAGKLNAADPLALEFATQGDGVDINTGWALFQNPAPLPPITVQIGTTTIGTITSAGKLDGTVAVVANGGGQSDFAVTITTLGVGGNAAGLCRVYGLVQLRTVVAPVGRPGGVI